MIPTNGNNDFFNVVESQPGVSVASLEKQCLKKQPTYVSNATSLQTPTFPRRSGRNTAISKRDQHTAATTSNTKHFAQKNSAAEFNDLLQEITAELKDDVAKLHSKLDRSFNMMQDLANRIVELERKEEQNILKIEDQDRRIKCLEDREDEQEKNERATKVLLSFEKLNTEDPNCKNLVEEFLKTELKIDEAAINQVNVSNFGKSKNTVLIECKTYMIKSQIFKSKKFFLQKHKNKSIKFSLNEFLSKKRSEILKKACELKKIKKLHSAFSFQGNVYIKRNVNDEKKLIKNIYELLQYNNNQI